MQIRFAMLEAPFQGTISWIVLRATRVLLTRGMKVCYVHFLDRDTERFVRNRIEQG